jgi:hypothetical protein
MKILKIVVKVVGLIATVLSFIPGPWQGVAQIVAAGAALVSAALEVAFPAKAGGFARGSPTDYRLDPQTGIPYLVGRTQYAGTCVKRETWGKDNKYQCFTSVYSLGPINAYESFTADKAVVNFDGAGNAIGQLSGNMWLSKQVGLCPSPVLNPPVAGLPRWTAASKMSGLAASHWIIMFNKDGEFYTGGPPTPGVVVQGVKVYDPRLDSTYPGGSGACRALDESTYVYSETPHLHALTYALGRWQNGKRRFGIGFPVSAVDLAYFVNGANVDEANLWKVSGLLMSTDNKWNALKQLLEAGCAEPITLGGKLSGRQSAPRVSIATITSAEVVGRCSVSGTNTRRNRINGGIPRRRSEDHGWETISDDPVRIASYVTADGGVNRTREFEWYLVNQLKQAAQLTAYQIMNAREMGPIELMVKVRWMGLKPGDCITLTIPELNMTNQKVVVLNRSFDVESGAVTLTCQTETDAKHADALALNGSAPPVPALTYDADTKLAAPGAGAWAVSTGALISGSGTVPSLRFTGATDNDVATAIEFSYRKVGTTDWIISALTPPTATVVDEPAVEPGANYEGRVRYLDAISGKSSLTTTYGPVTVNASVAGSAVIANAIVGQGALATVSVANWQTQVGGTAKPADNAGTSSVFVLSPTSLGTLSIRGNDIIRTDVGGSWNTTFVSAEYAVGSAFVSAKFQAGGNETFFGLTDGITNSYVSLDYAFYRNSGVWQIWESGAPILDMGASYNGVVFGDNTTFKIIYSGLLIQYYADGVLMRTVNTTGGRTFRAAGAALYNISGVREILFGSSYLTPDINGNIIDSGGGYATVPRNEIKTSLGTAAAIAGQAATATDSSFSAVTGATKPENNATIDANIIVDNPIIIYADSSGAPKAGEINKVVAAKLRRLGVDLTSGVTWAATTVSGNATCTISGTGTGTLTITGPNNATLALQSTIRLDASYQGAARSYFVSVLRQDDPVTTGGVSGNPGTTATTTTLTGATATTYGTAESAVLPCKAGTAGQVACIAPIGYKRNAPGGDGVTGCHGKWQWRVPAGTFADITTEVASGSNAQTVTNPGDPPLNSAGSISCNMTKTGLTPGADYEFKFLWRKDDVSGVAASINRNSGTLQAAGS